MNKPVRFEPFAVYTTLTDSSCDVETNIDVRGGVYRVASVTISATGDEGVTTAALREVALGRILREAVAADMEQQLTDDSLDDGRLAELRAQGPTDETLAAVAHLYQVGRALGRPPAKYVEERFDAPRTTVSKWVRKARDRGFLGNGLTLDQMDAFMAVNGVVMDDDGFR